MKQFQSLDDLIGPKAVEFAAQMKRTAASADKEEEIRIAAERQLAFIEKEAGVKLEGRHEFTVASGRVDSVYSRVIIEYKNPHGPDCIGPGPDSPGTKKVVEQIKKRFYDLRSQHGQPLNSLFGVGLDGKYFVFIRFRDDKWQVQDPVEVNKVSAERFLWALFNLGQKGKPFSPDYLAGDFGSGAKLAQDGIHALYEAIATADHPKAIVFFSQWKILFGEVCGYDVDNPSDKIKKLAEFYGVPLKGLKPAELLFAVHTYYALFMKLLASEIVGFFHKLPRPLQRMMQATTSAKLKREMEELEAGSIFRHLNITNFLEGDLFAWYIPVWAEPVEEVVRKMVVKLDQYNPGTLSEDPPTSRDLLKKLYQQLFPKSVRHDMGEYYTPDWLAEHVLNELDYVGDPDKRILDPACGSGTFLVMAIKRIRQWYDKNREKCSFGEDDLCRKILANVIGFDLNPLAVMAARTNYLIAIRGLIGRVDKVEIPIYLCDSILTPSEYGDLFTGKDRVAKVPCSACKPPHLVVPREIAVNADLVARYAQILEDSVRLVRSQDEFMAACREESLPVSEVALHKRLYSDLLSFQKANKNGVWARIIKNAFAPLFAGRFEYVAGNPPWINWENLPETYRHDSIDLWNRYGLKATGSGRAAIGKSKHEMAALFLYVCADHYLADNCRLGFVITQSLFKNKGAAGFRTFKCRQNYLVPKSITDMVECTVFSGAVNRTATIVVEKAEEGFTYPIHYKGWQPHSVSEIPEDLSLEEVRGMVNEIDMRAFPSDPDWTDSAWVTCPASAATCLQKVIGKAFFRAYEGVNSGGLVGAYWLKKVREVDSKHWLIQNMGDAGKIKVPSITYKIESAPVYPYLRGRDIKRWFGHESCFYLLPYVPASRTCFSEATMRKDYPNALSYLAHFKKELLSRKTAPIQQQIADGGPFYPVLGIGPYTFARWKVLFKDLTELFQCCVVGPEDSSLPGKPLLPDYTLRLIPAESEDEAHYIAALLNSSPCVAALYFSSAGVQTQRYHAADAEKVRIGLYAGSADQRELARLSRVCHQAAKDGDTDKIRQHEAQIDAIAARLWGISRDDLAKIRSILDPIQRGCRLYEGISGASRAQADDRE